MDTTLYPPKPKILEGYQIRPIEQDDSQAINRMLLEIEAVDQRSIIDTLEDRQRDFSAPDTNPKTDTLLVLAPNSQAAGMGWIFTPAEPGQEYVCFLWGEVHPQHRRQGLGEFILSWLEARASQILSAFPNDRPHVMRTEIKSDHQDRIDLHESHGFSAVRSSYRMQRDLTLPIDQPDLPPAFRLIDWDTRRNEEALQVFNESFSDHWGFIPLPAELWQSVHPEHEDFRPDLSCMVISAKNKELVGISVNKVNRAENQARGSQEGWIMDLGVRQPWRKQGIATAMLNASMQAFKADGLTTAGLGVDTENLTGALRIYERLGFDPVMRYLTYSKPALWE